MYSRCLSCRASLGRNDCLEELPVGRSLAFDPDRGRLWVVCRACRSWNLAPLRERWEALEELERQFEIVRVEASSDNVAMGRARDGTVLLRIGPVDRRELAEWRYAGRLRRRWKRAEGVGWVVLFGPVALGMATGVSMTVAGPVALGLAAGLLQWRDRQGLFHTDEGRLVRVGDASKIRLKPDEGGNGWHLEIPRRGDPVTLRGGEALRALRATLPRANLYGGKESEVAGAVARLDRLGSEPHVMRRFAERVGYMENMDPSHHRFVITNRGPARPHRVSTARPGLRLAIEIAANEELESRVLAGEMALLEREWKEAEELAAISDGLLIPEPVDEWLQRRRAKGPSNSEQPREGGP